jgi:dTDP-4-amino-4,6-dideoxygalactose transaminase/predicted TPR repeat methyltransferase
VVTTNLYGAVDPIREIASICQDNNIFLVEDLSLALGCDSDGRELGLFGDVIFLSLGPGKVISTINGGIACWRNTSISQSEIPGTTLDKIDWRAFFLQLAYPILLHPLVFGLINRTSLRLEEGQDNKFVTVRHHWSLQQAHLSALLLRKVEDEARKRRRLCNTIKHYQSKFGYDLVNREAEPKLTRYPCLAASHPHREEIIDRLKNEGIMASRGFAHIITALNVEELTNTAVLVSRLYTLPCYPSLSDALVLKMLTQINQSNEAVFASVRSQYSSLVDRYGKHPKSNGHAAVLFRMRRRLVAAQLCNLPGGDVSVLDSGCGNGALGPVFYQSLKVAALVGADFVPKSLEIAKDQFGYTTTHLTNVMSIDQAVDGKQFDLVNSCEVILYIPPDKYRQFFRTHRRCVADGRHFLLTFPNLRSIYRMILRPNANFRYNFSPNEVLEALSESGFKVVSIMGSDILGAVQINLNKTLAPSLKRSFSYEISILCEAN